MKMRAERYQHVKTVVSEVHDGLLAWCRRVLREAGLETIEVYGQFPPEGATSSYVVLFPYRLGPAPKLVETSNGISLMSPPRALPDKGTAVPTSWIRLGRTMAIIIDEQFPKVGKPGTRSYRPDPAPLLSELPKPAADWYKAQDRTAEDPWIADSPDGVRGRLPSLWWRPGFMLTGHYMAVANDGGRGTADRTSLQAPLALPGLSVIATGLHLERYVEVDLPPIACDPAVFEIARAMGESDGGAHQQVIEAAIEDLTTKDRVVVQVIPVHDLTNMDFANLMQALQRPLQPSLNLAIRLPLGAFPILTPAVAPGFDFGKPVETGKPFDEDEEEA